MVVSGIMDATLSPLTETDALSVLAEHGYRTTHPRREVLEAVLQQTRPFTAEQMVQLLPEISRATVYRTLEIMASVDILTRLLQSNGHPAYVVGEPGHRHHLICSKCGYVVAFTACPVEPVVNELGRSHDFAIQGHSLEIFGLCQNCR
jgi:Fe2+ or Zn2+ uptake regulation protein